MKNRFPLYFNLVVIASMDIILLGASWYSAFLLRFNFDIPVDSTGVVVRLLPVVILIKIIIFYFFRWSRSSLLQAPGFVCGFEINVVF